MAKNAILHSQPLKRRELSDQTGCNIETIRYYEKAGLMPAPPRSRGGHRLYGDDLIRRLQFIQRTRNLGFTLDEIRSLLRLVDGKSYTCAQIETTTREHVSGIQRKIADLNKIKGVLETMASQCNSGRTPECPVIDVLLDARP